ncbi:MAG: hypothetical protein M0Z38_02450 [Deltaproteobacteria bacterium]|nr:hypothetical protein [Deltaproteobacteria bacterium]
MKYICHMTIAHDDSKLQALRDKHGLAGYGAYWIVLEKIAAQMTKESPEPKLSLSLKKWSLHLDIRPTFTSKLLRTCNELGLISVQSSGEVWTLSVSNLLKYGDEYTRKLRRVSGQTPDKLRSYEPEEPEEPEEKENPGTSSPPNGGFGPARMGEMWNRAVDNMAAVEEVKIPKIRGLTSERSKKCAARIQDCLLTEDAWKNVINAVHADDWLSGRKPSAQYPNWCATFDYLVKNAGNIMRVLERARAPDSATGNREGRSSPGDEVTR